MKKILAILLVLLVGAAIAIAGCTIPGMQSTTGTPTIAPTTAPTTAAGATLAATTGATGTGSDTFKSVFDTTSLTHYEWKITTTENGVAQKSTYFRKEIGSDTFNGVPADYKKLTITEEGEDPSVMWIFYDKNTKTVLGTRDEDGTDTPLPAGMDGSYLTTAFDAIDVIAIWSEADYPLTNPLPETLTINGKTYVCSKYGVGNYAGSASIWRSAGVPLPVQIEYGVVATAKVTYQLWDWG